MARQFALSFHQGQLLGPHSAERELRRGLPWLRSPVNLKYGSRYPQLFRHSDATPIELFFDLFFVANVSTFSSIHEINKLEALFSYIGFFSIIWFTWLQITLHDARFARDSILERTFKALQLATMVGFASTGPSFSSNIRFENRWAFKSLTVILASSRMLLSIQHAIASSFMMTVMKSAYRKTLIIGAVYFCMAIVHIVIYVGFRKETSQGYYVWIAWTGMFAIETFLIFWISLRSPVLNLEDTHLNTRMSLLTLIIIGEGVISITKLVNRIVGRSGWTTWSLIHIFGVSTALYLLWQSYFDLSPRQKVGKIRQCIWVALHFPLHVALILLSEGSGILASTLDIFVKIRNLGILLKSACKPGTDTALAFVTRINATVDSMNIDFTKSKLSEEHAIETIMKELFEKPPLCDETSTFGALTLQRSHDLMGNVTTSLFTSMGIEVPAKPNVAEDRLLMEYLDLLGFVYLYYFVVAALSMLVFAAFIPLTRQHSIRLFRYISIAFRLVMAAFLATLTAIITNYNAAYRYMTSPMIIFTYALVLLIGLVVDRVLDAMTARRVAQEAQKKKEQCAEGQAQAQDDGNDSDDSGLTMVPLSPAPCSVREARSSRSTTA
ncbi:hypothetical protein KEM56_006660 [Ascosphaera pollenicola]|nr:hypothetical protein KEM56_006660 [Ascosphaera pollenicola]